ncbi:MexH family multidrug efflux RND transporter periplasmic adaptor subunit [Alphaproteobacteria bacterium]|nr:MexH family multidrug efflux RND transporter periplasmic adaptor subunit [Alphaproteobacteria bacterium]
MLKKKGLLCAISLGIVTIFALSYKFYHKKATIDVEQAPPVTVTKAIMGPVTRYINALGTLRPYDFVQIKSEVTAVISKIHFYEGSYVQKGDILVEMDDSTARAELLEAEALYRKAKSEFDPIEKLADKGVAAIQKRNTLKAEVDNAEARVMLCKSKLSKHKIYSPFGGIVGLREISEGQYVTNNGSDNLVKVVDCHPMKVDFKVSEVDIGNVYVDQEAKILVGGDKTQEYSAKIIAIDPECDKASHTFDVRALLDIPEDVALDSPVLKPGRFVSVKVAPDGNSMGIVIPEGAIERVGDDDYVYRVVEGMAVRTPVTVGMRKDGVVEIITGINVDDDVVTSGQAVLVEGKPVSVQDGATDTIADELRQHKELEDSRNKELEKATAENTESAKAPEQTEDKVPEVAKASEPVEINTPPEPVEVKN